MSKDTVNQLLEKANLLNRKAEIWYPYYRWKIEVTSEVQNDSFDDFAVWYTTSVARPCKIIEQEEKIEKKN